MLAPLGVALVSATLFAAFGAVALQVADDSTWGGASALHCLAVAGLVDADDCDEVDGVGGRGRRTSGCRTGPTVADGSPADWAFVAVLARPRAPGPRPLRRGILDRLSCVVAVLPFVLAVGRSRLERRGTAAPPASGRAS